MVISMKTYHFRGESIKAPPLEFDFLLYKATQPTLFVMVEAKQNLTSAQKVCDQ